MDRIHRLNLMFNRNIRSLNYQIMLRRPSEIFLMMLCTSLMILFLGYSIMNIILLQLVQWPFPDKAFKASYGSSTAPADIAIDSIGAAGANIHVGRLNYPGINMNRPEIDLLVSYLRPTDFYLEYGAGNHTLEIARFVGMVYSIEFDENVCKDVRQTMAATLPYPIRSKIHLICVPIKIPDSAKRNRGRLHGSFQQFRPYVDKVENLGLIPIAKSTDSSLSSSTSGAAASAAAALEATWTQFAQGGLYAPNLNQDSSASSIPTTTTSTTRIATTKKKPFSSSAAADPITPSSPLSSSSPPTSTKSSQNSLKKHFLARGLDRVFINGRAKAACAIKVLPYLRDDAVVFIHDFFARPDLYAPIYQYYDEASRVIAFERGEPSTLPQGIIALRKKPSVDKEILPVPDEEIEALYADPVALRTTKTFTREELFKKVGYTLDNGFNLREWKDTKKLHLALFRLFCDAVAVSCIIATYYTLQWILYNVFSGAKAKMLDRVVQAGPGGQRAATGQIQSTSTRRDD